MSDVPSEKTQAKAAEYLLKGRVRVQRLVVEGTSVEFSAHVYSATQEGDPYRVRIASTGWHCDCPARVAVCAHILACQTITDFDVLPTVATFGAGPENLDDFLADL